MPKTTNKYKLQEFFVKSELACYIFATLYYSNVFTFLQTYHHLLQLTNNLKKNPRIPSCNSALQYCTNAPEYYSTILAPNTAQQYCLTILPYSTVHNTAPQNLPKIVISQYCPTILTQNTALH